MKTVNYLSRCLLLLLLTSLFFSCESFLSSDGSSTVTPSHSVSGQSMPAVADPLLMKQYILDPLDPILSDGEDTVDQLLEKVTEEGRIRVINRLDVPFTPEGLLTDSEVQQQRQTIRDTQETLLAGMSLMNISAVKRFKYTPFIAMEVDEVSLLHLIDSPLVREIIEDLPESPALTDSGPLVGADKAWQTGYTGKGYTIVMLDTGVDFDHPFFGNRMINEACFSTDYPNRNIESLCLNREEEDFGTGAGRDCDSSVSGCDHGTLVAGIAAGEGPDFSGIAKEAGLISVQVYSKFNNSGDCGFAGTPCVRAFVSDQMRALEWVYELRRSHDIASVNLSTAGARHSSECNGDSRKPAVDNLRSSYIATVISSGNHGSQDQISAPSCISTAISVGSTTKSDRHSSFSNSASFLNLLAPGSSINSSVPGGGFRSASGTSMAAPHVSGAWAVVRQSNPAANVSEVLQLLHDTGVPVENDQNGVSKRRIQVDAAVGEAPDSQIIYNDELMDPWMNVSWNASVDFSNAGPVFSGSNSILVNQGAWGALSVRNESWNSTVGIKSGAVTFSLYSDEKLIIDLMLENDEGAHFPRIRYGTVEPGQWEEVTVAMSDLNPDGRTVHRINIMESSGEAKTYYVDAWQLLNETVSPGHSEPEDPGELLIYTDNLNSPWNNASWNASVDYDNTEQAYSGTLSVRVDQDAWGALRVLHGTWSSPIDIEPGVYEQLDLAVFAPDETVTLDLKLENSAGESFPRVNRIVEPGNWQKISVPMAELNPNGHVIHRVSIMETSGQAKSYFVDDWKLTTTTSSGDGELAGN